MNNRKTAVDSIHFQDRDLALLRGLFECRVMTTNHAAALYFDHKDDAAKKRLQKIKAAGFIHPDNSKQVINYPKATNFQVGLLINFGQPSLKWKRFINTLSA